MQNTLPLHRKPPSPSHLPMKGWWRKQSATRQDRFALLAPLAAVLLFMAAVVSAFIYLNVEEGDREKESMQRDIEYAQQSLRLRLNDQQEQVLRLAREVVSPGAKVKVFLSQAEELVAHNAEIRAVTWMDRNKRVVASFASTSVDTQLFRAPGSVVQGEESDEAFELSQTLKQSVYAKPLQTAPIDAAAQHSMQLQLYQPLMKHGRFVGALMVEYSMEALLRYGVPTEVASRYAIAMMDGGNRLLAGSAAALREPGVAGRMAQNPRQYELALPPIGHGVALKAQNWHTASGLVGSGLFWLIGALSVLSVWMLLANWRHSRRRVWAQQALLGETNFRRAMENSISTGIRAMDLQGRITYVNPAFCDMTGFEEQELAGQTAPFPYWPDAEVARLSALLDDELNGRTSASGIQVRMKRKTGMLFDARMYVSPLIDPQGLQTGWMTSVTDITEPNRIREELSAAHERFTVVLDALDSAVSVTPHQGSELLFANQRYRDWFGTELKNHHQLAAGVGMSMQEESSATGEASRSVSAQDTVDEMAGLPIEALLAPSDADTKHAEIFIPVLDKWLEVRLRYLQWVDGRLAQMVIASDITARRRAQEQATSHAEKAQVASRLITMGEMASSMAHELNQPLTAINNYCQGMAERIQTQQISPAELLGAIEKTARQAQRAGQIIQRIRSFVQRSEANRFESDVSSMVAEALELTNMEMRRHQVRFTHSIQSNLPPLCVDAILIEQVLINLLKNAAESVQHAERPPNERFVDLRVSKTIIDDQEVVAFAVTDAGKGIAPEVLDKVYEAFFTTKPDGLGIGLNLCRSIVESHQGRLKAENLYNGELVTGCRFSFWLPVASPSKNSPESTAPSSHLNEPAA
jgi:PAS domain S-box-containing protein